jgi:hypothetical protein
VAMPTTGGIPAVDPFGGALPPGSPVPVAPAAAPPPPPPPVPKELQGLF